MSDMSLALIPRSMTECTDLAKQLSTSSLLPVALKGKIPEVLMTIMAGQELGIPPIAALRSIHVIDGKTVLSADIMQAIVLGNGSAKYVKRISASDVEATYETLRNGDSEPRRLTWTIEQAKKAGLFPTKDNWRCYPRAMLASRCKAELIRDTYPDALAGCYTPDEADDFNPPTIVAPAPVAVLVEDADFTETAVVVVSPFIAVRDQLIADIRATTTVAALQALQPRFAELPRATAGAERAAAYEVFKAHLSTLTTAEVLSADQAVAS